VFKIIDEPNLPQRSTGTSHRLMAIGGGLAGIFLGFIAALGREFLDSSLQDEEHAAAELRIAVLTSIPEIRPEKRRLKDVKPPGLRGLNSGQRSFGPGEFHFDDADAPIREVLGNPMSIAGEHFRLLRAKLAVMQKT